MIHNSSCLLIAMCLTATSVSLPTFNIDRFFVGMCLGAAFMLVFVDVALTIKKPNMEQKP